MDKVLTQFNNLILQGKINKAKKVKIAKIKHAVGAVLINDEYYIIDQYLPIKKIEKWMTKQKGKIIIYKVINEYNFNRGKEIKLKLITMIIGQMEIKKLNNIISIKKT